MTLLISVSSFFILINERFIMNWKILYWTGWQNNWLPYSVRIRGLFYPTIQKSWPGMTRTFVQNQQIWLQKSDFRSKMLIFHYISYKFDKISHLKNQIWHWKIRFCQIWHLKISTFLKNQQTWHPWFKIIMGTIRVLKMLWRFLAKP